MLGLGLAADGETAAQLGVGRQVGGVQVQAVSRPGRARDAVVLKMHPRGFGIALTNGHGLSLRYGLHFQVHGVLVKAKGVGARSIVGAHVIVVPAGMLQIAFIGCSVADDAALDLLDAGLAQERFPAPEKAAGLHGYAVPGPQGGVSVADDVDITLQDAVSDLAGIANAGLETVIRAEGVEGSARGHQFQVGGGGEALVGIPGRKGVSVPVHGQDAPGGFPKRSALGLPVHILLRGRLGPGKKDRPQGGQSQEENPFKHPGHVRSRRGSHSAAAWWPPGRA